MFNNLKKKVFLKVYTRWPSECQRKTECTIRRNRITSPHPTLKKKSECRIQRYTHQKSDISYRVSRLHYDSEDIYLFSCIYFYSYSKLSVLLLIWVKLFYFGLCLYYPLSKLRKLCKWKKRERKKTKAHL